MKKKLSYEEIKYFIEVESNSNCKLISKEYKNNRQSLEIQCACGNLIFKTFNDFKQGKQMCCSECKTKLRHITILNDYRSYIDIDSNSGCKLLSEVLHNVEDYLQIQCKCGNEFITTFYRFKYDKKMQCKECGKENQIKKQKKLHNDFVKQCEQIGFFNEYELLGIYDGNKKSVPVKHKICGKIYYPIPSNILKGHGCEHCFKRTALTQEEFKLKVYNLVNDEYSVLSEYSKNREYVMMRHNKCNKNFKVIPNNFLDTGQRCPFCCKKSKGETKIQYWLDKYNIDYIPQKTFNDCKNKYKLPFDFYLPEYNLCIEFHGIQHYESVKRFGGDIGLKETQIRDKIKENYCVYNNIQLLIIPYWNLKNIDIMLKQYLIDFKIHNIKEINNPYMLFVDENDKIKSVNKVEFVVSADVFKKLIDKILNKAYLDGYNSGSVS